MCINLHCTATRNKAIAVPAVVVSQRHIGHVFAQSLVRVSYLLLFNEQLPRSLDDMPLVPLNCGMLV